MSKWVMRAHFRYLRSININNSSSHWVLTHAIALRRFGNPSGLKLSKWNSPRVWKVHSLTPSHILGSMLCDSQLPFWPATMQTLALVASPKLGLQHWSPLLWGAITFSFQIHFWQFLVLQMCQEEGFNICFNTKNKRALPFDLDCPKCLTILKPT